MLLILLLLLNHLFDAAVINEFKDSLSSFSLQNDKDFYDRSQFYGFWSKKQGYGQTYRDREAPATCQSGCDCSEDWLDCKGLSASASSLTIQKQNFLFINASSFPQQSYSNLKIFSIISCENLYHLESTVLDKFPALEKLVITNTGISNFPAFQMSMNSLSNIDLYSNNIDHIRDDHFTLVPSLQYLNLADNNIKHVGTKALKGTQLQLISLAGNDLEFIPDIFKDVSDTILYIGMEDNSVSTLAVTPFEELVHVRHVNLSSNPITFIEPGAFADCVSLYYLELHSLALTEIQEMAFANIPNLKYLSLYNTPSLVGLQGRALYNLPFLSVLLLQFCNIEHIDYRSLDTVTDLQYLNLDSNALVEFPHVMLLHAQLVNLRVLNLNKNNIRDLTLITTQDFDKRTLIIEGRYNTLYHANASLFTLQSLYYMDISNNKIVEIPDYFFTALKSLYRLYLKRNNIDDKMFGEYAFDESCVGLRDLKLDYNNLKLVPSSIYTPPNLNTIGLSYNLLTYLETNTFSTLTNLTSLDLNGNGILTISDNTFPTSLTFLNLNNNNFNFLAEAQFSNISNLVSLKLADNRISYLPSSVFANTSKLENLYLNNNNIAWLSESHFKDCPKLSLLQIKNNGLRSIEYGTLAGKPLRTVDFSYNSLSEFPDDCMFCDIESDFTVYAAYNNLERIKSNTFKNLQDCNHIDLSNNIINVIEGEAFKEISLTGSKANIILKNNPLKQIQPKAFLDIFKGKSISLENVRPLNMLPTHAFYNVKVNNLYLINNNFTSIQRETFYNVDLGSLKLSDANISFIAKHAIVGKVDDIILTDNVIKRLSEGVFEMVSSCTEFLINDNSISFIDKNSIPNCVSKVNLDNNFITRLISGIFMGNSVTKEVSFKGNQIRHIETLEDIKSNAVTLDLSYNDLPTLQDGILNDFSQLQTLKIKGNYMRSLGKQELLGSIKSIVLDYNNGRLQSLDSEILDELIKNSGAKSVDFPCSPFEMSCGCGMMAAIQILSTKNLYKGPSTCTTPNGDVIEFSNVKSSNYYKVVWEKIMCEPSIISLTRSVTEYDDDLPKKEEIVFSWKLPETAYWDPETVYCCGGSTDDDCNIVNRFDVTCYDDDTNGKVVEKSVATNENQQCNQIFSSTSIITSTTSSVSCTVVIKTGDYFSTGSSFKTARPSENPASSDIPCSSSTLPLTSTFYDLNNNVTDFQNFGPDVIYTRPKLQKHILGPYLYQTSNETDSIIRWFTVTNNTLKVIQKDLCLSKLSEGTYEYFARNWYPLDDATDVLDRDADFIAHNLYFTVRSSFTLSFTPGQEITLGGVDDMWLFVDGHLVGEVLAEADDKAALPCAKLSLTATEVVTEYGVLDFSVRPASRCALNGVQTSVNFSFSTAESHHVNLFMAQRRSLSSSLYLKLDNITPTTTKASTEAFTFPENTKPGGLISQINFDNPSENIGPFLVYVATSYENFRVEDNLYIPEPFDLLPEPNTFPGNGVSNYYTCTGEPDTFSDLESKRQATVSDQISYAAVILRKMFDYDTLPSDQQTFLLTLNVSTTSHGIAFYYCTTFKVTVLDVNDNCPIFEDGSRLYSSSFALTMGGKQLDAFDKDDGENKKLQFLLGEIFRPSDEVFYKESDYIEVEHITLTYTITIIAIDNGTIPRGSSINMTVPISAGCVENLLFVVNSETGMFHTFAPGWMVSADNSSRCDTCKAGYRCPGYGAMIQCSTCYQEYDSPDYPWPDYVPRNESGCADRSSVEFSFGNAVDCQPCKPGWICEGGVGRPVLEDMKYVKPCTDESCDPQMYDCQPGFSCLNGLTEVCSIGTYSEGNTKLCLPCLPGTFSNVTGLASCHCCPGGSESSYGKASCKYCAKNLISDECGMCRRCYDDTECPCLGENNSCSNFKECVNLPGNEHTCLACPYGFRDVNGVCVDLDECVEYSPCFEGSQCTNRVPGFKCDDCPFGYTGSSFEGIGLTEKQACIDIDECLINNGNCDINSECINLPGAHRCGLCSARYVGTGETQCEEGDYCKRGLHNCDSKADCIYTGPGSFVCQCKAMFAGDGLACGYDTDLDGYPDNSINCNAVVCNRDNCLLLPNTGQEDIDLDAIGDACDTDIDNDLIENSADPCPYVPFSDSTLDKDSDSVPDSCDNCPTKYNLDQADSDSDGVGDACSCSQTACFTDVECSGDVGDYDGDSVYDACDNCLNVPNAQQTDTDGDGIGDSCDDDIDGDTVPNAEDNCPYLSNPAQDDTDGDGKGDVCDDSLPWPSLVNDADGDGDGVPDVTDACPLNPNIRNINFTLHETVKLSTRQTAGTWLVSSHGQHVQQNTAEVGPALLIGTDRFEDVDYNGTFYVSSESTESGYMGIVFSYQSSKNMYLVMWRQDYKTWLHADCDVSCDAKHAQGGTTGLQIRAIHIPNFSRNWIDSKLWYSADSAYTTLLWQDPRQRTWDYNHSYRWFLSHRPSTGEIRVRVYGRDDFVVDSGPVISLMYLGGRLGVYTFHQSMVSWSNFKARCASPERYALYNTSLTTDLTLTKNFLISAWVRAENVTLYQPLLCTASKTLCLYISDGTLYGRYGDTTLSIPVEINTWHLVALLCDLQNNVIILYRDDVAVSKDVSGGEITGSEMLIGTDTLHNFTGYITDIRLITRLLTSNVMSTMLDNSLTRQDNMGIVGAHITFDQRSAIDLFNHTQVSVLGEAEYKHVPISGYKFKLREQKALRRKKREVRKTKRRKTLTVSYFHEEL